CEWRLRILMELYEIAGRVALFDPLHEHFEHVDAGWRIDAHMVCAGGEVEAHEIIDAGLPHPLDHGLVILDACIWALCIIGHVLVDDQSAAAGREDREVWVG